MKSRGFDQAIQNNRPTAESSKKFLVLCNWDDTGDITIIKMADIIVNCLTFGVRKRYGTGTGG